MKHEIIYFLNGNIYYEVYYNDLGQQHNESGPAFVEYRENGDKYREYYYLNGLNHNIKGPSYISYDENNKIKYKIYYLNDKFIDVNSDEEFQKYIKRLNLS